MERNVNYTVDINEIRPKSPQFAGVQGEHKVTAIKFSFSNELNAKLQELPKLYDYIRFRIDYTDSSGYVIYGEVKDISEINEPFYLTRAMTKAGGNATAVLKISCIDSKGTQKEFYTGVMRFYFDTCPSVLLADDDQGSIISPIVNQARIYRNEAYDCAQTAVEAENGAQMVLEIVDEIKKTEEKLDDAVQILNQCEEATEKANVSTQELGSIKEELAQGGYITGLKESNDGNILKFWIGTRDEYNAAAKINNCFYMVTDDPQADYVVEQGTIGTWKYTKWASGIAECFGHITKQLNLNTQIGTTGLYFTQENVGIEIPNIFVEDYIYRDIQTSNEITWPAGFYFDRKNSCLYGKFFGTNGGTYSATVYAMLKGRWK